MLPCRFLRAARLLTPLAVSIPLRAQGVVGDVTAFAGYYRPLGHFSPASVYVTSLPERPDELSAMAWGATAHVAFHHREGVLAQIAVTESSVPEVVTPAGSRGPTDARVVIATVQGQFDVSPTPRAYHLWLNAGPGVVRHGGQAYEPYASPTSIAGALGATLAVPLASHLQFTANSAFLLYRLDIPMPPSLRPNPGSLERGTQLDALFHVGLAVGSF